MLSRGIWWCVRTFTTKRIYTDFTFLKCAFVGPWMLKLISCCSPDRIFKGREGILRVWLMPVLHVRQLTIVHQQTCLFSFPFQTKPPSWKSFILIAHHPDLLNSAPLFSHDLRHFFRLRFLRYEVLILLPIRHKTFSFSWQMMLRNVFSRRDIKYLRKYVGLNILMHAFLTLIIKDFRRSIAASLNLAGTTWDWIGISYRNKKSERKT